MLRRDLLTQIHTYVFLMLPDTASQQTTPQKRTGKVPDEITSHNEIAPSGTDGAHETFAPSLPMSNIAGQTFQLSPQILSPGESDFLKQLNDSSPSFKLFMRSVY